MPPYLLTLTTTWVLWFVLHILGTVSMQVDGLVVFVVRQVALVTASAAVRVAPLIVLADGTLCQ